MYKILDYFYIGSSNDIKVAKHIPNHQEYLIGNYYRNLYTVQEYYKLKDFYVKRPNIFISLLNDIFNEEFEDIFDVYSKVAGNEIYFANNYYFTSTKNLGKIQTQITTVDEMFLLDEDSNIDMGEIINNWRDLEPIKVISTDSTDILFTIYYKCNPNTSFIVYKVNITLLTLQYYLWSKDQLKNNLDTDFALYLHQYAFNNILNSYNFRVFDNIVNRASKIKHVDFRVINDRRLGELVDIEHWVEVYIEEWWKILKRKRFKSYWDYTKFIVPLVNDLEQDLRILGTFDSENSWLYLLSILNNIFLFIETVKKDNEFTEDILETIERFKKKNISSKLPMLTNLYLNNLILQIEEKIKE